MSRKGFAPIIALLLVVGVLAIGTAVYFSTNKQEPEDVLCTQEAKQCPDGSFVGRTGPKCEFAECPPLSPILEGNVMSLLGESSFDTRFIDSISVDGNLVILGSSGSQCCGGHIRIVDMSDRKSPEILSEYRTFGLVQDVYTASSYVYIGQSPPGRSIEHGFFEVVDISDPRHPQQVANEKIDNGIRQLEGFRNYIVVGGFFGLFIFDVSLPSSPEIVVKHLMAGIVSGIGIKDDILTFSDSFGTQTIDISNPHNLQLLNSIPPQKVYFNPVQKKHRPEGALLQWRDGGVEYAINSITKGYVLDATGKITPKLVFSILISNEGSTSTTVPVDMKEITDSGNLIDGTTHPIFALGPGEQARGVLATFSNPSRNFTTGGEVDIRFTINLESTSSLILVHSSSTHATSTTPIIRIED